MICIFQPQLQLVLRRSCVMILQRRFKLFPSEHPMTRMQFTYVLLSPPSGSLVPFTIKLRDSLEEIIAILTSSFFMIRVCSFSFTITITPGVYLLTNGGKRPCFVCLFQAFEPTTHLTFNVNHPRSTLEKQNKKVFFCPSVPSKPHVIVVSQLFSAA